MASEFIPESERVIRLLNEVGTRVLLECFTNKLFQTFLKQKQGVIKPKLLSTDVETVYPQPSHPQPFMLDLSESVLRTIITRGADDLLKNNIITITNNDDVYSLREIISSTILTRLLEDLVAKADLKKRLFSEQLVKVYLKPPNFQDFDISLFCNLLFALFPSMVPTNGFKTLPKNADTKEADDIMRIRMYRNMFAHEGTKVATAVAWRDICGAIERLGKSKYRVEVNKIKDECLDLQMKRNCETILTLWREQEIQQAKNVEGVKEWAEAKIEKQTEEVKDIIDRHVQNSTEIIKKTIAEYKKETERKLESLMNTYWEKVRKCMIRKEETERTTGSTIEEIFKELQEDIKNFFIDSVTKMTENMEQKVSSGLKDGMSDLRDLISNTNEAFLKSMTDSMHELSTDVKIATTKNEDMMKQTFESLHQILVKEVAEGKEGMHFIQYCCQIVTSNINIASVICGCKPII